MKKLNWIVIAVLTLTGVVTGYLAGKIENNPKTEIGMVDSSAKKALYWYDPMTPQQHFDAPGKSPFMDMELVPKYAEAEGDVHSLKIDPQLTQNIGVRLAQVERGTIISNIDAVGNIGFNARDLVVIQARANGFVERVYARAPGDFLRAGDPVADILVPEWVSNQLEFISLLGTGDTKLISAARERMRLSGIPADVIKQVELKRAPQTVISLVAPKDGVIQTLDIRQGMTIMAGQTMLTLNGLETVWLETAIPESQSAMVKIGQKVIAHLTAFPGETLTGQLIAILPETNMESRTLRVRAEFSNTDHKLKPGMYAEVSLQTLDSNDHINGGNENLFIPSEAIIRSGKRNVVMVALENGHYQPVEVNVGAESNGKTIVLSGLSEAQTIVVSGQFLIDSEANLNSVFARTNPPEAQSMNTQNNEDAGNSENGGEK